MQVTYQSSSAEAVFPASTVTTGDGSFNFQNFTIGDVSVGGSIAAIELGIPNENLSFSQNITVTMNVDSAYNGQTLTVRSQSVGETDWTEQGQCTVTSGQCTFTTNHATTYIITENGTIGLEDLNLTIEVQDTLTMDCYDNAGTTGDFDIALGTTANPGEVTAGTPAVGISTCDVTTNDDQGYYLSMVNSTNGGVPQDGVTDVLRHEDPNSPGSWDGIAEAGLIEWDWNEATQAGSTTVDWDNTDPTGLGFSVMNIPESSANNPINTNWTTGTSGGTCPEGTGSDINVYAAIPDTTETIAAVVAYNATTTTTDICYKLDISPSQPSGAYTGSVTYTATSDASGYYQ